MRTRTRQVEEARRRTMPDGGDRSMNRTAEAGESAKTELLGAGEKTESPEAGVRVVWTRDRDNPEDDIAISWTRRGDRLELNASMEMGAAPYETFLTLVNAVLRGAQNGGFPDRKDGDCPEGDGTPEGIISTVEEPRE